MSVGPRPQADGPGALGASGVREGKTGEQIVGQAHGKYYESASRGQVYSATSTTGRAPGTALSTTPPFVLYNPAGSGKRASLLKVGVGQAPTGTLGTGMMYHCGFSLSGPIASQSGVAPVVGSGAALTANATDVGGANAAQLQAWSLPTLNAAPPALYPFAQLVQSVGGTTTSNQGLAIEDLDGGIVLEQTGGYAMQAIAAAGSSPLVLCGAKWEEVGVV